MAGIIVAFPNKDNAASIRNLLQRNGLEVTGVCTSGAQVLHYAETAEEGIVVCGYKLKDMMYQELREYLPPLFELLLVASRDKWSEDLAKGVVGLSMPVKAYDLVNTVNMMLSSLTRKRKERKAALRKRDPGQEEFIKKAKDLLMYRNHMTEDEAHRYLQKCSMDSGTNLVEVAQMVLSVMSD